MSTGFSDQVLAIDPEATAARIADFIREVVLGTFRRRGAVVGLSGGIDSSVVAALAARALGPGKVFGICMPELHTSGEALALGQKLAQTLGIAAVVEDIGPVLESAGCYARQLEAIRTAVPEYASDWKCKLVLPSLLDGNRLNVTRLTVQSPAGEIRTVRLSSAAYLQIVASTNYKQRVRKMTEYYHADRLHYAVSGTPNRLEYDQGFFVKQGDGAADFKPIAHLYKTQIYALARHLGLPADICSRPPTTDTFSMPQTQEEFYFALPYDRMDLCLYGVNHGIPSSEVAPAIGLTPQQVERVYQDIESKRRATRYLHSRAVLVEPVPEV